MRFCIPYGCRAWLSVTGHRVCQVPQPPLPVFIPPPPPPCYSMLVLANSSTQWLCHRSVPQPIICLSHAVSIRATTAYPRWWGVKRPQGMQGTTGLPGLAAYLQTPASLSLHHAATYGPLHMSLRLSVPCSLLPGSALRCTPTVCQVTEEIFMLTTSRSPHNSVRCHPVLQMSKTRLQQPVGLGLPLSQMNVLCVLAWRMWVCPATQTLQEDEGSSGVPGGP